MRAWNEAPHGKKLYPRKLLRRLELLSVVCLTSLHHSLVHPDGEFAQGCKGLPMRLLELFVPAEGVCQELITKETWSGGCLAMYIRESHIPEKGLRKAVGLPNHS